MSFLLKEDHMELQKILSSYPAKKEFLLEILIDIDEQKVNHFISQEEIAAVSKHLGITESHVCSVVSFYTLLSTTPRGKYIIQICKDVPCYLRDDFNVLKTIQDELNINVNETTKNHIFSLEFTACIGCCDEAPAMRINHKTYTNLTRKKVLQIINDYKEGKYD
jgi:NADH-quinone oxidoreductase subunit E